MHGKDIDIRVTGDEKTSFWYTSGSGKRRRRRKSVTERKLIDFSGKCYTFQGPLAPGDYTLDFEIVLPPHLPASIWYKNYNNHDKPKAKILYHIHAVLETQSKEVMTYKSMLVVHQPPVAFQQDASATHEAKLTTWGCS